MKVTKYLFAIILAVVSVGLFAQGTSGTKITAGNFGNYGWKLTGNSGTNPNTNFIGTTDSVDLILKVNSIQRAAWNTDGTTLIEANQDFLIEDTNHFYQTGIFNSPVTGNKAWNIVVNDTDRVYGLTNEHNTGSDHFITLFSTDTARGEGISQIILFDRVSNESSLVLNYDSTAASGAIGAKRLTFNSDGLRVFANTQDSLAFIINNHGQTRIGYRTNYDSGNSAALQVKGSVGIDDGTQGAGKVLASDANGKASWTNKPFASADSATIYALTPTAGTTYYCTDCTGSGVLGRIVSYFGAAWRRLTFN